MVDSFVPSSFAIQVIYADAELKKLFDDERA
jgi:hypothetical protein